MKAGTEVRDRRTKVGQKQFGATKHSLSYGKPSTGTKVGRRQFTETKHAFGYPSKSHAKIRGQKFDTTKHTSRKREKIMNNTGKGKQRPISKI